MQFKIEEEIKKEMEDIEMPRSYSIPNLLLIKRQKSTSLT